MKLKLILFIFFFNTIFIINGMYERKKELLKKLNKQKKQNVNNKQNNLYNERFYNIFSKYNSGKNTIIEENSSEEEKFEDLEIKEQILQYHNDRNNNYSIFQRTTGNKRIIDNKNIDNNNIIEI